MSQIYKTSSGSPTPPPFPPFNPAQNLFYVDDFFASSNSDQGQLQWAKSGTNGVNGTATNPGIISIDGSIDGGYISLTDENVANLQVGGGAIQENFVYDLVTLSDDTNTYVQYIGFTDVGITAGNTSPAYGIYFQYTDSVNSGNWQVVCNSGSGSTVVNTAIAAATGFHNYQINVNAAGTSVSFKINGVTAGTAITTNIPSQSINPGVLNTVSAGTSPNQNIDLFYMTIQLTVSR